MRLRSPVLSLFVLAAAMLPTAPTAANSRTMRTAASEFAARLVRAQNIEREKFGVPGLGWDPMLSAAAADYARELAATDKWGHSAPSQRPGQGENLWRGSRSAFTLEQMVADWVVEKAVFRPGTFPNVSATGRFEDVGHYTQIIWPDTRRVGCAVRSSAAYDYLVCRYSGPGNVIGHPVHGRGRAPR